MENLYVIADKGARTRSSAAVRPEEKEESGSAADSTWTPMVPHSAANRNDTGAEWRAGEFFKCLSSNAVSEFESLATPFCCPGDTVLITKDHEPSSILFLLQGRVKLTMNCINGKRLTLGTAGPGEILGLTAAVTGCPYEITAVAQVPCRMTSLPRQSFLDFLLCYPAAWHNSARLLGVEYKRGCEQLRLFGQA